MSKPLFFCQQVSRNRACKQSRHRIAWMPRRKTYHCTHYFYFHTTLMLMQFTQAGRRSLLLIMGIASPADLPSFCWMDPQSFSRQIVASQETSLKFNRLSRLVTPRRGISNVGKRTHPCKPTKCLHMCFRLCKNLSHDIHSWVFRSAFHKAEFRPFVINVKEAHPFSKNFSPQAIRQ